MCIEALGHVASKVRDEPRAQAFYNGVSGVPILARLEPYGMTLLSFGNGQDFAIMVIGEDAATAPDNAPGLSHATSSLEDLRAAKADLEAAGIVVVARDHGVTQSLYFHDPDGNEIEVHVDTSDSWKQRRDLVARSNPLGLA